MKKLLILTTIFIVGCAPSSTPTTNLPSTSEPTTVITPTVEENLFISEVYASYSHTFGKAIEIGYIGEDIKCLEGYKLHIYSGKNIIKTIEFTNDDYIDKHGTFVIANKQNDEYNYHSKADLILEDNYIYGSNKIELINPDGIMFESFGSSLKFDYALTSSCLKIPVFYGPSTGEFDRLKLINLKVDENYQYLGNLDCPVNNQQDILDGPRIDEEMYKLPFEDGNTPGGGFAEVTLAYTGDGDTSGFTFKNSYVNVEKTERVRYMNINTPEIAHGDSGAQPWGEAAKEFNNDIVRNAKKFLIQSVKGYGFRETYGRLLGYVWYSTKANPELSDYRLLNYEMVKEGYAYYGDNGPLKDLYSGDIYYSTYFDYAYLYAQNSKIRIHGEKDPNFDY